LLIAPNGPQDSAAAMPRDQQRHRATGLRFALAHESLPQHDQQTIDEFKLSPGLVGIVARQFVKNACELPRDDLAQEIGDPTL
jgi:hypothetical protein